ncbi:MAG: M18 family aminopeptidase [Longicatena sp.]|nr:M18 family aminopeptidase [Longicatena sp.]
MNYVQRLIDDINQSPCSYFVVDTIAKQLTQAGYVELKEYEQWSLQEGCNYFVRRNQSSIISFRMGTKLEHGYHFQVVASHGDSPTFKLKDKPEVSAKGNYTKFSIEGYGGMIAPSWVDRPLSIAGRVLVRNGNKLEHRLLNVDQDLLVIPNMAIHVNNGINKGFEYKPSTDLQPIFSVGAAKENCFHEMLAKTLDVQPDDIVARDIVLYNRAKVNQWGWEQEFIPGPRIDNQFSVFTSLYAFMEANVPTAQINMHCVFDNEEVGSTSKQGAKSTFLRDVIKRIGSQLDGNEEDIRCAIAKSFMVSCDNAHAVHPGHPERADAVDFICMNQGPAIKHHANQRYSTDAFSAAIIREVCQRANVPFQEYSNHPDMPSGGTLGILSSEKVSMHTVDIGTAQLAMHSAYETAGAKDVDYMVQALTAYYQSHIIIRDSDTVEII